jgi:hypothetical protein
MENRKPDKGTSNKISFISFIIPEFVAAFKWKSSIPRIGRFGNRPERII